MTLRLLAGVALLLSATPLLQARFRAYGYCTQGNTVVVTNTQSSTTKVMGSFPSCTVNVYANGTTNLSTIYSDNSGTAKGNPFTADANGYWFFYADNGRYDVRLSGAGIATPFTLADIELADPANASPNVTSFNGRTGAVVPAASDYSYSQIAGTKQGNTNVPQMAGTNSGIAGATLCDDASGNATTSGCNAALPSGTQLQYLRIKPNTGNNTTQEFAGLGTFYANDYNFPPQTCSNTNVCVAGGANGSVLVNGVQATLTLTPCPVGVATKFWISGGVGAAESISTTGGTCTSGAASGTIIFTPVQAHTGSFTVASNSDGLQECLNAVNYCDGAFRTYTVHGPNGVAMASNQMLRAATLDCNYGGTGTFLCLNPTTGVTVSTTTVSADVNATAKFFNTTSTFSVTAIGSIAAGDLLQLTGTGADGLVQVVQVRSVSAPNVTTQNPVVIRLANAASTVAKITMTSGIMIKDVTVDGTNTSSANGACSMVGLYMISQTNALIQNVLLKNWNNATCAGGTGGLSSYYGYANHFQNITATHSGSAGGSAITIISDTNDTVDNVVNLDAQGFGIGVACVKCSVSNLLNQGQGTTGRGIKIGSTYSTFTNLVADGSASTCIGVTSSYRNIFNNLSAHNCGSTGAGSNDWGFWTDGTGLVQYNIVNGIVTGNPGGTGGGDIALSINDDNNVVRGISGASFVSVSNANTGTALSYAAPIRSSAYKSAVVQSIPNSTFTDVTFDANNYDFTGVNGFTMHSTSVNTERFTVGSATVNLPGLYNITCGVDWNNSAAGGRLLQLVKVGGGSPVVIAVASYPNAGAGDPVKMQITANYFVFIDATNVYFKLQAFQDSGGALNIVNDQQSTYCTVTSL